MYLFKQLIYSWNRVTNILLYSFKIIVISPPSRVQIRIISYICIIDKKYKDKKMPVFEYKCSSCNSKFEVLHKSSVKQEDVTCPECDSKEIKKLFSSFCASVQTHSHESVCNRENCGMQSVGCGCAGGSCGIN